MAIIALLTDFGMRDSYVAQMKAVIYDYCAAARCVDITHDVAPGDIRRAAFVLWQSYRYFPAGTVFVVVVDPGVGTSRVPLIIRTSVYCFIAPDNGVLSWTLDESEVVAMSCLAEPAYRRQPLSRTFHGRDIFAPAAAHYAQGTALESFGPPVRTIVRLPRPALSTQSDGTITGEVIGCDRFGNIVTSIPEQMLPAGSCQIQIEKTIVPVRESYASVAEGQLLAIIGSSGYLEIAVNRGSAQACLNTERGMPVICRKQNSI